MARLQSVRFSTIAPGPLWVALSCSACAFDPGEPIGRVVPALSVALDLPEGRLVGGRWVTANDYAFEVANFDVVVAGFSVGLSASAATSAVAFDPAAPPEGYGLCHGGHCHADDGRLVPYEEIEAELAGGGAKAEESVTLMPEGSALALTLDGVPVPVTLGACPDQCAVGAVRLVSATADLERLRVVGTVFDRRPGDAARLPPEGLPIALEIPVGAALVAPIAGAFGLDEPASAQVTATLLIQQTLFDSIDFASLVSPGGAPAGDALLEALSKAAASSVLDVTVSRP